MQFHATFACTAASALCSVAAVDLPDACAPTPPPGFQGLRADIPIVIYRRNLPHWRQVGASYFVTFRLMGRDYDAAVMAGGHCGFGLGATPNAVANMEAIAERFGPAPRAFLVLPMVGAFFIDFSNALILTGYINLFRP